MTAGPTSEGGGGSVAARRRPRPRACLSAQPYRPTRASGWRPGRGGSGRGPRRAGTLADGAHLNRSGHLRRPRLQAWGPPALLLPSPRAAARVSPADCPPASPRWAACRFPASWRREGGGRRHGSRPQLPAPARSPAAADPDPPSLTGAAAVAARAALARRRVAAREIPPPRPLCPASRNAHWLAATPVSAAGLAERLLCCAGL